MANNSSTSDNTSSPDLHDSEKDIAEMKSEPVTIDLPDVSDIPGQENVIPPSLGELADVTISSADEEGDDLFDDDTDDEDEDNSDSDVSAAEKEDLEETATNMPTRDDMSLQEAELDDTDEDGTPLNEAGPKNNRSGADLDIPGAEDDDENEDIGEEDEENNEYSLGGDDHDDIPEDNS